MIYLDKAEFMAKALGPSAAREAMMEGGVHYAQTMANSIAPIPSPDIPLVIAAAMTTIKTLSDHYPGAKELATPIAADLEKASALIFMPDPEAVKKWREQNPPK